MSIQERASYGVVLLIVGMSNYTDLTPYDNRQYDASTKFHKTEPCKNRIRYHNARGHPKYDKCIIKTGTTEMGFNFIEADMWFNP